MIYRRSTLRKADILAVLEEYQRSVVHFLMDGKNVVTPLANFATSIRGRFENEEDSYDAGRHSLEAAINAGVELKHDLGNGVQVNNTVDAFMARLHVDETGNGPKIISQMQITRRLNTGEYARGWSGH